MVKQILWYILIVMAYNTGTNRKAKDFNRALQVNFQNTVTNYNATDWDNSVSSGTSVKDTNGGAKDSLCTSYETTWSNAIAGWSFTKSASNYLIGQQYGSQYEFYPPCIIQEASNDYKIMAKSNGDSYGYHSTDGVTFSSDGKMIPVGTSNQWDYAQASCNVLRKVGNTYYAFYSGYQNSPTYNHKIGLTTNTAWDTNWTKDSGNPQYDVSNYNNANGTSYNGISVTDAILIGNQWYYFGTAYNNAFTACDLIYGIGDTNSAISSIRLNQKITTLSSINSAWNWAQGLSVFKHPTTGKWMMTFTMGTLSSSGTDNQAIYCFASQRTDAPVFTLSDVQYYPIMYPDTSKNYEDNYNYAANWLKDNNGNLISVSGNYRLYYSGHQSGATPTYTGVTCLAEISTIPQI